ncbi:sensor histidine kinase [Sellimonas intestinalis]|uniref:sensor histidine kinase n=1 Tax=Sellimonas intestinalis TaxID=1653434 RepID=UPI0006B1E426|nr:sensor histidine kinase [Sellimonas intestinalis]
MLKGYMKDRAAMFGCLLICYGTLFLIGYLYDIPFEKTRYIAEFSGAGVFLCLLVDILKYAERWKELKRCIATSDTYPGMFYTVPGDLEALYRSMIAKMRQEKEELIFEDQKRYTEMMDYYGMWAHQIKTPIAAMRILVQSGMDREENEENQKLFRQLQMELFKTEQYVEMVLSYLKIGDIAKDMVLERCDLGKVVRQAVKKYSRLFILQKLSLEMGEIAEIVLTDEKWLSFVVEQILSNALKYTKSGSVSIYLEQEGVLVIKDTGIGISAEDLPRIMEKGYTGYNGRIDKRSTGIGLYLCKKVMDKLHHQLRIDSEDGKGTKVVLDLRRTQLDLE